MLEFLTLAGSPHVKNALAVHRLEIGPVDALRLSSQVLPETVFSCVPAIAD